MHVCASWRAIVSNRTAGHARPRLGVLRQGQQVQGLPRRLRLGAQHLQLVRSRTRIPTPRASSKSPRLSLHGRRERRCICVWSPNPSSECFTTNAPSSLFARARAQRTPRLLVDVCARHPAMMVTGLLVCATEARARYCGRTHARTNRRLCTEPLRGTLVTRQTLFFSDADLSFRGSARVPHTPVRQGAQQEGAHGVPVGRRVLRVRRADRRLPLAQ